jgi:hypothetical protein
MWGQATTNDEITSIRIREICSKFSKVSYKCLATQTALVPEFELEAADPKVGFPRVVDNFFPIATDLPGGRGKGFELTPMRMTRLNVFASPIEDVCQNFDREILNSSHISWLAGDPVSRRR